MTMNKVRVFQARAVPPVLLWLLLSIRREPICMVTISGDPDQNRLHRSTSADSLYDDLPTSVPTTPTEEAPIIHSFKCLDRVQVRCPGSPLMNGRYGTVMSSRSNPISHTCLMSIDNDGTRPDVDAPQLTKIWHLRLILNNRPEPAAHLTKRSVTYQPGDKVTVENYGPGTVKSHLTIHPDYLEGAHYVSLEKNEFVRVQLCGRSGLLPPNDESKVEPSDESSVVSATKPRSLVQSNNSGGNSRRKIDEHDPNNSRFAPDKFDWQASHTLMYMCLSEHDEVEPTMEPYDTIVRHGSMSQFACVSHFGDNRRSPSSNTVKASLRAIFHPSLCLHNSAERVKVKAVDRSI